MSSKQSPHFRLEKWVALSSREGLCNGSLVFPCFWGVQLVALCFGCFPLVARTEEASSELSLARSHGNESLRVAEPSVTRHVLHRVVPRECLASMDVGVAGAVRSKTEACCCVP